VTAIPEPAAETHGQKTRGVPRLNSFKVDKISGLHGNAPKMLTPGKTVDQQVAGLQYRIFPVDQAIARQNFLYAPPTSSSSFLIPGDSRIRL